MGKPKRRLGRRRVNETLDERIGALIRHRRSELGWSQQTLGAKLNLTFQQVQKYEKGVNQLSVARLLQVCDVLSVPISYFLEARGPAVAAEAIDYTAARSIAGIRSERVRSALVRLARECERL